jgi:hypothetical protein
VLGFSSFWWAEDGRIWVVRPAAGKPCLGGQGLVAGGSTTTERCQRAGNLQRQWGRFSGAGYESAGDELGPYFRCPIEQEKEVWTVMMELVVLRRGSKCG